MPHASLGFLASLPGCKDHGTGDGDDEDDKDDAPDIIVVDGAHISPVAAHQHHLHSFLVLIPAAV